MYVIKHMNIIDCLPSDKLKNRKVGSELFELIRSVGSVKCHYISILTELIISS